MTHEERGPGIAPTSPGPGEGECPARKPKIPVVGEDSKLADLEERLIDLGYAVCAALSCGRRAIERSGETHPDLALIDLGLGGGTGGLELAKQLGGRFGVPVVYLLSAEDAAGERLARSRETGPFGWVLEPFDPVQLRLNIEAALSMHERGKERAPQAAAAACGGTVGEPAEADAGAARTIEALRHRVHVMETVFENMSDALIVADENEEYLFRNVAADRIIGTSVPNLTFDRVPELFGFHLPDEETLFAVDELPLARAVRRGESSDEFEALVRTAAKPEGVHVSITGKTLRDEGASSGAASRSTGT